MLKIGDLLYCHDVFDWKNTLSIGKCYRIYHIDFNDNELYVIDDIGEVIWFTITSDDDGLSYENWFKSQNEHRKQKLKNICLDSEKM